LDRIPTQTTSYRVVAKGSWFGQDPYANYVLQSALAVAQGSLYTQLVEAIKPYLSTLRGTPHGKRILSKINVKHI
jgi:hypothetical protein